MVTANYLTAPIRRFGRFSIPVVRQNSAERNRYRNRRLASPPESPGQAAIRRVTLIQAQTTWLRSGIRETSSPPTPPTATESARAETLRRYPELDPEFPAIPRGFGGLGPSNPNRRRRALGSMSAAARVYLCWQVRRFGLLGETKSKTRVSTPLCVLNIRPRLLCHNSLLSIRLKQCINPDEDSYAKAHPVLNAMAIHCDARIL
jgi:hypothetical protein